MFILIFFSKIIPQTLIIKIYYLNTIKIFFYLTLICKKNF